MIQMANCVIVPKNEWTTIVFSAQRTFIERISMAALFLEMLFF